MHKSPALKPVVKNSFLPLANLLLVPLLTSSAMAAPIGNESDAAVALPKPAAAPKTSTSRKLATPVLPQGTLQREAATSIVSAASQRVEVQKMSTRVALQTSLPTTQPRIVKAQTPKAPAKIRTASAKPLVVSSATPATAPLFAPAAERSASEKVAAKPVEKTTKIVEVKTEVSTKVETKTVTRLATLPREEAKPVAKKEPVMRRAQPTVLASRHSAVRDGDDELALLAQLERELKISRTQLARANAKLSEGQRELQKMNGVLRQAMLEAGPDAKGLHPFVRVAQRYAGTPYVWGGESARGFDCSGFIIRVMRDLGYKALPHSAATQFNYGMPVAQALLKPGDLVFFANTYKPGISHVGIYLGKRRFIHAAGTGLGTIVSNLDHPKYQAKYAGARRLVSVR